ncbi:N-acetyltransferase family protein [uncultured Neglectibacter sp.]|uniref:GNAT family N-acetyltransferase n=1 Tax=uncultured Neglectibacter sp. TaxID=1924108 RepID=UPI0034DF1DAD
MDKLSRWEEREPDGGAGKEHSMLVKEIPFVLKDGRKALLRCPRNEDIPGLLNYLVVSSGETDFIVRSPEECDKYTPEKEAQWIEQMNSSKDAVTLVCEVNGTIAGNCEVKRHGSMKTRHRATVGIALLSEFWGQGIGTKMFEEMIRVAEGWDGVTQMELEFVEGNARARGLYEKMGFRITGMRPDAIRRKDGVLLNEYLMVKKLSR